MKKNPPSFLVQNKKEGGKKNMEFPLKSRLFYRQSRFLLSNKVLCDRIIYRVEDVMRYSRM